MNVFMSRAALVAAVLFAGCIPENIVGSPPLEDPGVPQVGGRCTSRQPQSVDRSCNECVESFFICAQGGFWACVARPGICTPVPNAADAAVTTDVVTDVSADLGNEVGVDAAVDVSADVISEDVTPNADAAVDAAEASVPAADASSVDPCAADPHTEGSPCLNGAGICAHTGVWHCDRFIAQRRCDAPLPGMPTAEICDNLDNDCDGRVDDGVAPRPCYSGESAEATRGICHTGMQACAAGVWGACVGEVLPQTSDVCTDTLDNDCDGIVNDGCCESRTFTPAVCTRGLGICTRSGMQICRDNVIGCSATPAMPGVELCANSRDDDCDGMTDEPPCSPP